MERLVAAVQELSLAHDIATVQRVVRTAARELTGADGATFVLREGDLCHYVDEDAIEPLWKGHRFPMQSCVSGWVMLNRRATVIPDVERDPRVPHDVYGSTFVVSLSMVPIRTLDPIGAIGTYWARKHEPDACSLALLQALADTTAVALENVRVHSELEERVRERTSELELANDSVRMLSITDELTGLHNRRGFRHLGTQAVREARRNERPIAVLFIDLDGLKPINDRLGHDAGDAALVDVAKAMRATFREADVVARIGGDEFCVLALTDDPASLAARFTENLASLDTQNRRHPLTASVGTVLSDRGDESLEELVARADEAMYREKHARRPTDSASMADFDREAG